MSGALLRLQQWFLRHCDGDWEHADGILIETLDNPGWMLRVALEDTELEEAPFEAFSIERDEHDWLTCRRESDKFAAYCGPKNLEEVLTVFLDWAESERK